MSSKLILFWLNRRKTTPRCVRQVTFLAEQIGDPEQKFKNDLSQLFDRCELVKRAYLALVEYSDGPSPRAALCLACLPGVDEEELLDETAEIFQKFRTIFDPNVFLDILFLMDFQELEILTVCKPFYIR